MKLSKGSHILVAATILAFLIQGCSSATDEETPGLSGNGGFSTNVTALAILEGETGTVEVGVTAAPDTTLVVHAEIQSGGSTFVLQGAADLTFDASNWDQTQSFTVGTTPDSNWSDEQGVLRISVVGDTDVLDVALTQQDTDSGPPTVNTLLADWAEGTETVPGATRDFYNRAGLLEWENRLGDYTDADGVKQGSAPFSSAEVDEDEVFEYVDWEVTTLVQDWLDGTYFNKGFYLKRVSGGGSYYFSSREHAEENQRPQLVLETSAGTMILPPAADTFLKTSTTRGFGHEDELGIESDRAVLIRFDFGEVPAGTTLTSATLRLFSHYENGTVEIGVFRCSQGHEAPADVPEYGLSQNYPEDANLESDEDVIFFAGFESEDWEGDWTGHPDYEWLDTVTSHASIPFEPIQGKALQVKLREGSVTALNMRYEFMLNLGYEPEELFFRYYLWVGEDWAPLDGGKFPGLAGTYGEAGWGGRKSDGTNGWSARGKFLETPPESNPLGGRVPLGCYTYHADMEDYYGDDLMWQHGYRGYLEKNRWYCIEQQVKLNDPDQANGILRGWVDGRLAYESTTLKFRTVDTLKIDRLWMNVYHGGLTPMPQDSHVFIDNVVISRSYVGPIYSGAANQGAK